MILERFSNLAMDIRWTKYEDTIFKRGWYLTVEECEGGQPNLNSERMLTYVVNGTMCQYSKNFTRSMATDRSFRDGLLWYRLPHQG